MNRRFLVVARVGDGSLHPRWLTGFRGADRTFDVAIDYYGDVPGKWSDACDFPHQNKGGKWPGLVDLLVRNPSYVTGYDAVWFPDDDLDTDAASIDALFALHTELGLGLSQPALTADSYYSYLATLQHPGFALRYTNFVECMAPVFSRDALALCLPSFSRSVTGWGLDLAWQSVLAGSGLRSAVLDCVPIRHTRAVGTGDLYRKLGIDPAVEMLRVATEHGAVVPHVYRTLGGFDEQFLPLNADEARERLGTGPSPTLQQPLPTDTYPRDLLLSRRPQPVPAG